MNDLNPNEIISLPFPPTDFNHHSRATLGFHIFLNQFFVDFRSLEIDTQGILSQLDQIVDVDHECIHPQLS